jgi:hypothetical protein
VDNQAFDVFISYARVDGRHAADIDSVLRARGLSCFLDRRSLSPGLPWVRGLEKALNAAKAAIILVGPQGLGSSDQRRERSLRIVPVGATASIRWLAMYSGANQSKLHRERLSVIVSFNFFHKLNF